MARFLLSLVCCAAVAAAAPSWVQRRPAFIARLPARAPLPVSSAVARAPRTSVVRMVSHPEVDNEYKRALSEQKRWTKSTKQLATLGPVSCNEEMIEKLFLAGADVFRLNFSHGKHEEKAELIRIIRKLEDKYTHPIAILADLQGPKLRVDTFEHDKVSVFGLL